jgi:hypothetical protein
MLDLRNTCGTEIPVFPINTRYLKAHLPGYEVIKNAVGHTVEIIAQFSH